MIEPTWEFEAIGTHWRVTLFEEASDGQKEALFELIQKRIAEFDKNYSRFRDDSLVALMSRTAGEYTLPDDARRMFDVYRRMYDVTGGLVTPLVGKVLVDAGYDSAYSLVQKKMSRPKGWDDVLGYDFPELLVREPALLDFGAGGKGYLVDIVGELLEEHSVRSYCVDAGGDMRHRSVVGAGVESVFLRVGLENPEQTDEVIGVATIANQSLCGSAGNRRRWPVTHNGTHGTLHHIINPRTLSSPEHILAVWVIADTTLLADILTTALFFVSPDTLTPHFDFQFLILHADHSVTSPPNFPAELFTV